MRVHPRGRRETPLTFLRRLAPAAAAVAVLTGAVLVPSASAVGPQDVTAVIQDFSSDGDITACKFSKGQLEYVSGQIGPDIDAYAPDFRAEINSEIARWTSGNCSGSGNGGGSQDSYRATITSAKLAKSKGKVKVKVACPATAAASCKVKLSSKLAGKSAGKKSATVGAGKTKSVTIKLKKAARARLKTKGGKLKLSAKTTGSTLAASTRSITVAAP